MHVLIVDDDDALRGLLARELTRSGYRVRQAADGAQCLASVKDDEPDVALLDIGLPGRSGHDLAREIRARLPRESVRLIAVTGYGQPEDRARSAEAGFDAHLVKPVEPDELRETIERLVFQGATGAAA